MNPNLQELGGVAQGANTPSSDEFRQVDNPLTPSSKRPATVVPDGLASTISLIMSHSRGDALERLEAPSNLPVRPQLSLMYLRPFDHQPQHAGERSPSSTASDSMAMSALCSPYRTWK